MVRAIEIYHNKPIFYGLGNFLLQLGTVKSWPSDAYAELGLATDTNDPSLVSRQYALYEWPEFWESLVARITYSHGRLVEIRLQAIELGRDEPSYRQGTPRLANPDRGKSVIERVSRLSQAFGTDVTVECGVGLIAI